MLRVVFNLLIVLGEIGSIVTVAWIGYNYPSIFAALTFLLSFLLGISLENARLRYELPFYFSRRITGGWWMTRLVSFVDATVKAILTGVMALLTFSGTDQNRLFWVVIAFGGTMWIGTTVLRYLVIRFNALASRWGFFRLAAPLGLFFSLAVSLFPEPSFSQIGYTVLLDFPERPNVAQASEVLFVLTRKFDALVDLLFSGFMDPAVARVVSSIVSVNVLSGFVIAMYSMVIAQIVCWFEKKSVLR